MENLPPPQPILNIERDLPKRLDAKIRSLGKREKGVSLDYQSGLIDAYCRVRQVFVTGDIDSI